MFDNPTTNMFPNSWIRLKSYRECVNLYLPDRGKMRIQKSSEDYLEAMLMMQEEHGYIRSIDIAERLGVSKPSVSYATKRLRENGYLTMDDDKYITLTESGMEIARQIYTRHKLLTDFFVSLGVDEKTAREDACRVEHDISKKTFEAIRKYTKKLARENKAIS